MVIEFRYRYFIIKHKTNKICIYYIELSGRKILRNNSGEISHVKNADHPGVIEHLNFIKKLLNEYLTNSYSKESKLLNVILQEMEVFYLTNCGRIARNVILI